jgi:ApaG protein
MSSYTIYGIKIFVKTSFREDLSNIEDGSFFYNYEVVIENYSDYKVQLISRYWRIEHLFFGVEEVKGEGVIGEQPIINSRNSFAYTSGCDIRNVMGKMQGHYVFKNLDTDQFFKVQIPVFKLVFPPLLN